ncbi:predicted protein [Naegleria gruberi]|uniref:Predicted protein n=1 Tax=Naegleria gruberi TaxID=5762 RepID=D2VEY5_NAEGR|nr:uncharacterized protein NAEGRDRAFT_48986 [Naegleria gruberi]EFC44588.1 predicted protein [Naegleria gruberi]|eukprot:XP_002677332.1 predicted protein [Naegleria gruberi strain NEG-M]
MHTLFFDACDINTHLKSINESSLTETEATRRKANDFGNINRSIGNVSIKGFQTIRRIVCLSVLLFVEILGFENALEKTNQGGTYSSFKEREIAMINDNLKTLIDEPHTAAIRIFWAAFLHLTQNNVSPQVIYDLAQKGIKENGLEFIRKMFDRDDNPFVVNNNNIEGYRTVVSGGVSCIYFLFRFHKIPYQILEQVFSVTEIVIQPKPYCIEDQKLSMIFNDQMLQKPYSELLTYFKLVFPARKEILRLLSLMCCDNQSTVSVRSIMESQDTYCIEMTHTELKRICGLDQSNSNEWETKQTPLVTITSVRDETTNVVIPPNVQCIVVNQTAETCLVTFNFSSYIWKLMFSQIIEVLQNSVSINNPHVRSTMHYFLNLLYRVISFKMLNIEKLEKYLIELLLSKQIYSSRDEKRGIVQLLSHLLKYFSDFPLSSIPMEIVLSCSKCLHALSEVSPVDTACQVSLLIQKYHFSNILREECMIGRYGATLSLLDTVLSLAKNHPGPMDSVIEIQPFICSNIFSVHDSWRYQKLEERWLIALKCLQIFNQIAQDSLWAERKSSQSLVGCGGRPLLNAFLHDGSLYQVLFSLIGLGGTFLENILRHEKTDEAATVQSLIVESLKLLDSILRFRQIAKATNISTFEDVLFSKLLGKQQVPLITSIFEFIDHPNAPEIRILACKIITLIAQLTEDYNSRPPSLVGYLGNQSSSLVGRCLYRLQSVGESDELKIALLDLISTTVEIQRGLADLFLTSTPAKIKIKKEKNDEELAPGGVLVTILKIIENTENYIVEKRTSLVRSALAVIQSIFQNGENRSKITKILRNDSYFWKSMKNMFTIFTKDESTSKNIDILRSITSVIAICSVDMYNLRILKQDHSMETDIEKTLFEKDSKTIQTILKTSISFIMNNINYLSGLIQDIDRLSKRDSQQLGREIFFSDYLLERNTKKDVLYDTDRIVRWETGISAELLDSLSLLNQKIAVEEAFIALLKSLHALFSVSLESPLLTREESSEEYFLNIIDILVVGLKISEGDAMTKYVFNPTNEFGLDLEVYVPLPKLLDNLLNTFHIEVAAMLAKLIHKFNANFPPTDLIEKHSSWLSDHLSKLTHLLHTQVQRKKSNATKEILGCLLMYFVDLDEAIGVRTCSKLTPILFQILKTFNRYEQCTELAISILAVCIKVTINEEYGNYICRELCECLTTFDGVDEQHSKHTINVLNLLLAFSTTRAGSSMMVANNILQKFSGCTFLSSGCGKYAGQTYFEGERTYWHTAWRYSLKIITTLLNCYYVATQPKRNMAMMDEDTNYGQYQYFVQQVQDFCNTHRKRLVLGLDELWDKRPLTFALIEEVELIGMLVNALARSHILPNLPYLVQSSLVATAKCVNAVKHFRLILSAVTPITQHERKLHEKDKHYMEELRASRPTSTGTKTRRPFRERTNYENTIPYNSEESPFITHATDAIKNLYQGREMLNWNTQIDLTVFGTLQSLVASIRCLTILPSDDGIEQPVEPVIVLSMQSNSPNIETIFKCAEACVDTLKIIPSSKYNTELSNNKTGNELGSSTPTETLSPSFSATTERMSKEQEAMIKARLLVTRVVNL